MRLTGRVPFGEGGPEDRDKGIHVLRRAVHLGVNHFDTAAFYRSSLHGANRPRHIWAFLVLLNPYTRII
jgi:pyridoxine 4-dehydrogenase